MHHYSRLLNTPGAAATTDTDARRQEPDPIAEQEVTK